MIKAYCSKHPSNYRADNGLDEPPESKSSRLTFQAILFHSFIRQLNFNGRLKPETRYITSANCVTPNDDEGARVGKESRLQLPLPGSTDSPSKAFGGGGGHL